MVTCFEVQNKLCTRVHFLSDIDIFWFDFVFVKPRCASDLCLNVQTDYYNGHPRHLKFELPDYLRWIQLSPLSVYGAKEAFPWQILTEMISYLINVGKNSETRHKQKNQPWHIYLYSHGFIRGDQAIRLQSAEDGRCNNHFALSSSR